VARAKLEELDLGQNSGEHCLASTEISDQAAEAYRYFVSAKTGSPFEMFWHVENNNSLHDLYANHCLINIGTMLLLG